LEASRKRESSQSLQRIDLSADGKKLQNGLAKLVLTITQLLKEVLERQALRRVESGSLTDEEVERLGLAFLAIDRRLTEMSREFGIKPGELRTELASLVEGAGLPSTDLVDVIDRLLVKGVAVAGQLRIAVADINLIGLDLLAVLYPIYKDGEDLGGRK
jgi:Gas vesicle protein K/Gas vesicle protein